jgi:hypothetical protein
MLEIGLRVGDAVSFDPRLLSRGRLALDLHFRSAEEAHRKAKAARRISHRRDEERD